MEASKKWNWPTKAGAAVAKGIEKSKERGLITNAYESIKTAMELKNPEPPKK